MSLLDALQHTIIGTLRDDVALTQMLAAPVGVHERIPSNRRFPFVVVEQSVASDWSTDHERGMEAIMSIGVWSRFKNRTELYALSDRVVSLLEARFQPTATLTIVLSRMITARYERDPAQNAYRALIRLRFLIEPTQ